MDKYALIVQDTSNELELGKIYNISGNWIYNDAGNIKMYYVDAWQLKNMFRKVDETEAE